MTNEQEHEYMLLCEEYGADLIEGIESLGYVFDDIVEIVTSGNYVTYDATNHEELGYKVLQNSGLLRYVPAELIRYIDYKKYGRYYDDNADGNFVVGPKGHKYYLEVIN